MNKTRVLIYENVTRSRDILHVGAYAFRRRDIAKLCVRNFLLRFSILVKHPRISFFFFLSSPGCYGNAAEVPTFKAEWKLYPTAHILLYPLNNFLQFPVLSNVNRSLCN